uniref:Vacuolar-sorting protein SNF8 n=1 Tax=Romanomermis culicivorax TaxID=13658 RepID=A0A915HQE9_ROMCU
MARRGVGIGAIQRKKETEAKFKELGSEIASEQLNQLSIEMESFRTRLEDFAHKYSNDIRKNPQFRRQFQEMCASIGVDPLASSKGFWAEKLGIGDFYYQLGIQIIEVCLSTNHINGGVMTLEELKVRLTKSRNRRTKDEITNDDILRAIGKLKIFGNGFQSIPVSGGRYIIQSIPGELNMDYTRVLELAEVDSFITEDKLRQRLNWDTNRIQRVVTQLVGDGLCWIDHQSKPPSYWFPGLFAKNTIV